MTVVNLVQDSASIQVDPHLRIKSGIERVKARIAKWDHEAAKSDPSWIGWLAYRKFCEDMAAAARERRTELENEHSFHQCET
jgi:hypothetical protein